MSTEESTKIVTLAELQENSKREKLYILLHGKGQFVTRAYLIVMCLTAFSRRTVYNVTNFIDEVRVEDK